jgi:hypothetical protein
LTMSVFHWRTAGGTVAPSAVGRVATGALVVGTALATAAGAAGSATVATGVGPPASRESAKAEELDQTDEPIRVRTTTMATPNVTPTRGARIFSQDKVRYLGRPHGTVRPELILPPLEVTRVWCRNRPMSIRMRYRYGGIAVQDSGRGDRHLTMRLVCRLYGDLDILAEVG